jgi:type II secretory ATPase GspE/PulE/Tfp pilus assembly ATPase PilB-like protein
MAVNTAAGLTFSNGLRSLLRQDPDVLMVGEIRDADTAEISVNSAMTGHLVLSTLHTNNAFLAPQRLVDMGVQSFVAGSVVNLIIAQRLVRTVCENCSRKVRSVPKLLERYGGACDMNYIINRLKKFELLPSEATLETMNFQEGAGCDQCNNTGYLGRTGIYELIQINEAMGEIIIHTHSAEAVKKQAIASGTTTMLEDGLYKIFTGKTTFEEVLRVTKD